MGVNKDAWKYWYPGKEAAVHEDVPRLEKIFRESGVSRILDLGCGTGRHTIYFAERGFDVYGFDFSPYAVQRSEERLKERNLSARLMVWDMSKKFPYQNEFFDAVIATRVIHHARTRVIRRVISEIDRTMKKSAYFYAQVPMLARTVEHRKSEWKMKAIEAGTHMPLDGPEKGIPHHSFAKQEILSLLNGFGFEIEEIHEREGHYNLLAIKRR